MVDSEQDADYIHRYPQKVQDIVPKEKQIYFKCKKKLNKSIVIFSESWIDLLSYKIYGKKKCVQKKEYCKIRYFHCSSSEICSPNRNETSEQSEMYVHIVPHKKTLWKIRDYVAIV